MTPLQNPEPIFAITKGLSNQDAFAVIYQYLKDIDKPVIYVDMSNSYNTLLQEKLISIVETRNEHKLVKKVVKAAIRGFNT